MANRLAVSEKWDRSYAEAADAEPLPCEVLVRNAHLLPTAGRALDLACGLGGNALFLARRNFQVDAYDISTVALARLTAKAKQAELPITTEWCDVEHRPIPQNRFDVVVVSRFLERTLSASLIGALADGGLLYYQTYVAEKTQPVGPNNPQYLLARNELLDLFGSLTLVAYREEARLGDWNQGYRNEAYLIAQKL